MGDKRDLEALPLPLSERILRALPGPANAKVVAWALLGPIRPLIGAGILVVMGDRALASDVIDRNLAIQWVFGYITILALLGTRALRRDLERVLAAIPSHAERAAAAAKAAPIGWWAPPLVISVVSVTIGLFGRSVSYPVPVVISDTLIIFLILIPIATWLGTYAVALWRLDSIGRAIIDESPFPGDRTLGTRQLGALAFRGFVVFSAAALPFLLILAISLLDVAQGLGIFFTGLAVFVIALWRVRRLLVAAKARHVARALQLYNAAVKPLRDDPKVDTLSQRSDVIAAASDLLSRANSLAEWPVDEALPTRLLAIVLGVVTTVISAFVLRTIGFG